MALCLAKEAPGRSKHDGPRYFVLPCPPSQRPCIEHPYKQDSPNAASYLYL